MSNNTYTNTMYNGDTMEATAESTYGINAGTGLTRQKIGLIISVVTTVFGVVLFFLDMYTPIFRSEMVYTFLDITLPFWIGSIIVSYVLIGFGGCLRRALKLMFSGFYLPVWPINFITGLMTIALGCVFILFCPAVIAYLTYREYC